MDTEDTSTGSGPVIVRDVRGRFLPGTRPPVPITRENAVALARKRHEKYRQAAVKRITGEIASIDPTVSTAADAFGVVAASQVTKMLDSERPRIEDLIKLRDLMTGVDAIKQAPGPDAGTDTAGIVRELAQFAATIIGQYRDGFDNSNYLHHADVVTIAPDASIQADPDAGPGPDAGSSRPAAADRTRTPAAGRAGRREGGGGEDMGEGG